MSRSERKIAAVVLAAGASRRMGQPKLVMPWKDSSVIGHVVRVLLQADLDDILVVTGGSRQLLESALSGFPVSTVNNPDYLEGEMLSSAQLGLKSLSPDIDAALITLGDQPFLQLDVIRELIDTYRLSGDTLIVPSYQMKRGHPWLVDRLLWDQIYRLEVGNSLRNFLHANQGIIKYIEVRTDSISLDLDTPEDYHDHHPM